GLRWSLPAGLSAARLRRHAIPAARRREARLLGGVAQGLFGLVQYPAHVADAARALRGGVAGPENLRRTRRAGGNRPADLAFADASAVADVHERRRTLDAVCAM